MRHLLLFGFLVYGLLMQSSEASSGCACRGYGITLQIKNNTRHDIEVGYDTTTPLTIPAGQYKAYVHRMGSEAICATSIVLTNYSVKYRMVGTSKSGTIGVTFNGCESPNVLVAATPTETAFVCSAVPIVSDPPVEACTTLLYGGCDTDQDCSSSTKLTCSNHVCLYKSGEVAWVLPCETSCASGACYDCGGYIGGMYCCK